MDSNHIPSCTSAGSVLQLCKVSQNSNKLFRRSCAYKVHYPPFSWKYKLNKMNCELMLTYNTPALRQTGSRNLTGPKTLPTIWGTYMKLVTKYEISAINRCWEKCAYKFNVYKNQLSRQTGSSNPTGPKTLPTISYTYMTLVTKYQISAINSYWEKCDEKYLGRTDRGKTVYPLPLRGAGV